jgi:hypothetical protein
MSKGLLTLQTDLKSLRYGNDKPYITKDINDAPSSDQTGMQVTKRVDDLSRIAQMLVDRPGLKHLGNEALLHQIGVQDRFEKSRKSGKSVAGSILKELGGTALTAVKVVGSTLAQVPVNGTGTHFVIGFGGNEYLKQGGQRSSWLDRFLKTTAGTGGVNGAKSVLNGKNVILDHRGEEGYRPMIDTQFTDEIEFKDARPIDIAQSYIKQDGSLLARENGKVITDNTGLDGYKTPNEGLDRIDQELKVNIDSTYLRQDGRVLLKGVEGTSIDANVPTRLDNDTPAEIVDKFQSPLADLKVDKEAGYDITAAQTRDKKDPFLKSTNKLDAQEAEAGNKTPKLGATVKENKLQPYIQPGGEPLQGDKAPGKTDSGLNFPSEGSYQKNVGNGAVLRDFRQKGTGGAGDYTTKNVTAKGSTSKLKGTSGTNVERNDEMIPFTFTIATADSKETLHFSHL